MLEKEVRSYTVPARRIEHSVGYMQPWGAFPWADRESARSLPAAFRNASVGIPYFCPAYGKWTVGPNLQSTSTYDSISALSMVMSGYSDFAEDVIFDD